MLELSETDGVLELASPMPVGTRVLFALFGLVPLLAPYELLFRVQWTDWRHPFFFFAAAISLGAMCVSAFFVFAAVAGLEQRARFDIRRSLLTYSARAPLTGLKTTALPIGSIDRVDVVTHGWSDGPDSYSILMVTSDGRQLSTGSSESRELVELYAERIRVITSGRHLEPEAGGAS